MNLRGIILLEGADSSGKSTLARHLVAKYGARYIHSTVRRGIWRWHVGALRMAVRYSQTGLVVLDRHWISELVYGATFRGAPEYDVAARCLDRVLRRYGALTVLCSPADQLRQAQRWADGRAAGKHEHFDRVREVIARYADLRDGNVAHPGDGYLDQLIRYGDYSERDDVMVYDLDRYPGRDGVDRFGTMVIRSVQRLRSAAAPYDDLGPNLAGRYDTLGGRVRQFLFVGEAPSPRSKTYAAPDWPWCDRDDRSSAGQWFNAALHLTAQREDRLVFTNAVSDDPRLAQQLDRTGVIGARVIALGGVAARAIEKLSREATEVVHPAWHRRFRYGEGVEGYAKLLQDAMR